MLRGKRVRLQIKVIKVIRDMLVLMGKRVYQEIRVKSVIKEIKEIKVN